MGDKPAEKGSSSCQVASTLALMQKNTLEIEQMSIPATFSRSAEVVNALQDWTSDPESENKKNLRKYPRLALILKQKLGAVCWLYQRNKPVSGTAARSRKKKCIKENGMISCLWMFMQNMTQSTEI